MPIPTRATLKSYFETADQPTQTQFAALIDAMYDMAQEATDTAAAAETVAASAVDFVAANPGAKVLVKISYSGATALWTVNKQFGCTVAIVGNVATITFTAAFADVNYVVLQDYYSNAAYATTITTRNVGSMVVNVPAAVGFGTTVQHDFALFA